MPNPGKSIVKYVENDDNGDANPTGTDMMKYYSEKLNRLRN